MSGQCEICGSVENIDQHHTSYDPEEKVPLCRACHQSVHADPSHKLNPDDEGKTSTIEITKNQKAQLDELKAHSRESYKSVLEKLVESWQGENEIQREQTIDVEDARILSQHLEKAIAPYFEEMEAQLPSKMADELEGRIRK